MGPNADKSDWKKQDDHDGMEANNRYASIRLTDTVALSLGHFGLMGQEKQGYLICRHIF